ncbi:MAG: Tol-Pal system beta propeller repeat protein TolB [Deltaproteobacteria bacterium]|nr:Tol-Pal system beta propeller repeat protein TolB [Deltaproteobacteria bacterium]
MRRGIKLYILIMSVILLGPSLSWAQYDVIDITKPFLRKIPLAVPLFKNAAGSSEEKQSSQSAADFLSDSLDFTGYFKLLDRGAFLFDPETNGVTDTDLTFQNWTVIGAELLVTGYYRLTGDNITVELRLFDTFKAQRVLGKKYTGKLSNQRDIILRFCTEVIKYLTGNEGIFGSKIAFVSNGTGNKEIYISEFDGYNPRRLTTNNAITLFPAWSSDGKWMAFTSYKDGNPDLYIRDLAKAQELKVSKQGINITPAWAPGKFELAATLSFSGDQEIYLLTGSGKIIKRLTKSRGIDVTPTWSPDGKKIAFVSNRAGSAQIYIKDLTNGRVNRLTYEGQKNTQPSWSPRGDKIAYTSEMNGEHHIFTIGTDGQNPVQLTYEPRDNESPSWSPDGSLIVFSSDREGPNRLYVMTAFGTDQRRLLVLAGEQTNPKWSMNHQNN